MRVILEMETSDPDDFLTLLWLSDHPEIELVGVLVTPGSRDQCQLVRWGLDLCGRGDVPIGSFRGNAWWDSEDGAKRRVSRFHYRHFGEPVRAYDPGVVAEGPALCMSLLQRHPDATILVGAPPKDLGAVLASNPAMHVQRVVQQGGFAGDNLVPLPLEKFRGRVTCSSFNLTGAWRESLALLDAPLVRRRLFVSKNVCHGVVWHREMGAQLAALQRPMAARMGRRLMIEALNAHLDERGTGKAMHDLVAAACAVDEHVCHFTEVEIYRERGEWGARAASGTNTFISVGIDMDRLLITLAI